MWKWVPATIGWRPTDTKHQYFALHTWGYRHNRQPSDLEMKRLLLLILIGTLWGQTSIAQSAGHKSVPTSQESEKPKIKVFPNPASHMVNVLGLANSNKASIGLTDLSGNTLQEYRWAIQNNAISLPIADLLPGIYMIRIRSESQEISVKFYKQ
jgi:hypothetical protein